METPNLAANARGVLPMSGCTNAKCKLAMKTVVLCCSGQSARERRVRLAPHPACPSSEKLLSCCFLASSRTPTAQRKYSEKRDQAFISLPIVSNARPSGRHLSFYLLFPPPPATLRWKLETPALHGVYLDAVVQSPGVPANRRFLRPGNGPMGRGLRVFRDHEPLSLVSRNQRAGSDREGSQGEERR